MKKQDTLAALERVFVEAGDKMPAHLAEKMIELRKELEPPTPEQAAQAQILAVAELEAHRLIAAKELEQVIENTEGDNNDPATILTAIESLRTTSENS